MTIYRVTGRSSYRGHSPHAIFEAALTTEAEQRAISRGSIQVIERSEPSIQPGAFKAPAGWPFKQEE